MRTEGMAKKAPQARRFLMRGSCGGGCFGNVENAVRPMFLIIDEAGYRHKEDYEHDGDGNYPWIRSTSLLEMHTCVYKIESPGFVLDSSRGLVKT